MKLDYVTDIIDNFIHNTAKLLIIIVNRKETLKGFISYIIMTAGIITTENYYSTLKIILNS